MDTGPLLVHAAGWHLGAGGRQGPRFARLCTAGAPELEFLVADRVLRSQDAIHLTPHVLAEVSALARRRLDLRPAQLRRFLLGYRAFLLRCTEVHVPARSILRNDRDLRLGAGDKGVLHLARSRRRPVLTTDAPLAHACRAEGIPAWTLAGLVASGPGPASHGA